MPDGRAPAGPGIPPGDRGSGDRGRVAQLRVVPPTATTAPASVRRPPGPQPRFRLRGRADHPPPTPGDGDRLLACYFRDLARFPVLTPVAEAEAAHRIQRLEVEEWAMILSHPPVIPAVVDHLRASLGRRALPRVGSLLRLVQVHRRRHGRPPHPLRVTLRAAAMELGWKLHDLDCERRLLHATIALVEALPSRTDLPRELRRHLQTASFRRYVGAVECARRATACEKERFLVANLRLVIVVAKHYQTRGLALSDLVQEGNIGLMKAVDRYDVRKGFRFSTYATWWVRHAIGRAIAEKERLVRVPVYAIEQRRAARRALSSFEAEHGREPTDAEILAEIGLAGDAVAAARSWASDTVVSLDRPVGDEEGGRRFVDQLVDEHAPDPFEESCRTEWRSEIRQLLEYLPAVERFVITRHFGFDGGEEVTLKGIGNLMGRSRERARQIAAQAMGHLRPKVKRLR